MTQHSFKIGNVQIGGGAPCALLAEIGGFFNEDPAKAAQVMETIVSIARAVPEQPLIMKGEILDDPEICLPTDVMEPYADKAGNIRRENYRAFMERKAVKTESYIPLFKICRDAEMPFILSVYDMKAADFAAAQGASALKIASSNVVHVPLIRHVASLGLPMVIDTGRTTLAEAARAVETAQKAGCKDIVLQHSPDGHPALPAAHNLRVLQTYAEKFGVPTGLSDHWTGHEMMYMAIAMGASVIEKPVHTDPYAHDMDVAHSMGIDDLPDVMRRLHECSLALGLRERDTTAPIKGNIGTSQRQCLVAKRDLAPGEAISLETVRFAFPRTPANIPVEKWDDVAGTAVLKAVKAGQPLEWDHVNARAA